MDELLKGLERDLFDYVARRGYRIGDGADNEIRDRLRRAGPEFEKRIAAEGKSMEELGAEARRNFERLIDTMIEGSSQIAGFKEQFGDQFIGERTLAFATGRLCPLWPIC